MNHSIHSIEAFSTILKSERSRSDRTQNEFSMIIFDVEEPGKDNILFRNLVEMLSSRLRISDEMGLFDKGSLAVLLPDTSSKGALVLADIISTEIAALTQPPLYTVYSYPSQKRFTGNKNIKQSRMMNSDYVDKKLVNRQSIS